MRGRGRLRTREWRKRQLELCNIFQKQSRKRRKSFCFQTSRAEFYLFSLCCRSEGLPLSRSRSGSFAACKYESCLVFVMATGHQGKLLLHLGKSPSNNSCSTSESCLRRKSAKISSEIFFFFLISLRENFRKFTQKLVS